MKFLFILFLLTSGAFAQKNERCSRAQLVNTIKVSKKICHENINEFVLRSSVSCLVTKYASNTCSAECKDTDSKPFASLRVDIVSDCGREVALYQKMAIRYFR